MRSALVLFIALLAIGCSAEATGNPPAASSLKPGQVGGEVLETFDAAGYTYVRFEGATGEAWAAVPEASLEVGTQVVITNAQVMTNFESKTLGRVFDSIYFGTLEGVPASSPMSTGGSSPHGSKPGAGDAVEGPIEVARAEGATGRTVAELYAEKEALSGKSVSLRGKVVKYTGGIMGLNWIHLQDGTGNAADGTNDITVTTSATTAVGETILVEGVVAVDKDFGAGYRYAVIVEEASLK